MLSFRGPIAFVAIYKTNKNIFIFYVIYFFSLEKNILFDFCDIMEINAASSCFGEYLG